MLPSVAPPAGGTGSTTLFAAEAWDYCRRAAKILEGLKNREADQEGNPFTPSLFLSFNQSNDVNATSVLELEAAQTYLAATHDKLNSKSKALDF
jgi:hypothetical protein